MALGRFELPDFQYSPSKWVPFQDKEMWEKIRGLKREDLTKHPNKDLDIKIIKDSEIEWMYVMDMFRRIKAASDAGEKLVMILPQPWKMYRRVAELINLMKVDCSKLYTFNMDEYANEDGVIAPEDWKWGFTYSLKQNFYYQIDEALRPKESQMIGLTNETFADYGKRLEDLGGADVCYSGPGWSGHLAFIEPDSPEFATDDLEEFKQMGVRIATLGPLTLAQNSMHGCFGMSGDIAAVPPKSATIGPAQVLGSKYVIDCHAITVHGTMTSWQRLISRMCIHGPVTPKVPQSVIQLCKGEVWFSESSAADIEPDWDKGY